MNNKGQELRNKNYTVDDIPNDHTKNSDEANKNKGNFPVSSESDLQSKSILIETSSAPVENTSAGRTLTIERIVSNGNDINQAQKESIEVFIPQRDIGEEAVVVWDAGLVLAYYLEKHQTSLGFSGSKNPIHVVDVGAGTGVVGLVAASLGANVTLTDLPRFIPLLEEGISANFNLLCGKGRINDYSYIRAVQLNWGNIDEVHDLCRRTSRNGHVIGGPPDLIVVSDCVYFEASLAPLICTLNELARSSKRNATVLLSYENRDYSPIKKKVKEDFFTLAKHYFSIQEVPTADCHPEYSSEDITVVKMTLLKMAEKIQI